MEDYHSSPELSAQPQSAGEAAPDLLALELEALIEPKPLDKSADAPDLVPYLLPGEWITGVTIYELIRPDTLAPAGTVMAALTRAPSPAEIGLHGPTDASLPDAQEADNTDLNKYTVLFGRDSLVVAQFLADQYPALQKSTLLALARSQGNAENPMADEKPGKIIHEYRTKDDKIAQEITRANGWQWPYYGSIDATLKFVAQLSDVAAGEPDFLDTKYTHEDGRELTLQTALDNALEFITHQQDASDLGLIEYRRENPRGIENQIWRDSRDSMSHADGSLANYDKPIAALQAQADGYDALLNAAQVLSAQAQGSANSPLQQRADDLFARARHLQEQVLDMFWVEDERGGYFAAGLDRDEANAVRQLDTRTCDMGFVLSSQILEHGIDDPKVKATVATLFSDEMLNVSGVRTLSRQEQRFKPGGYHTGSVWLFTNEVIAEGLDNHGYPKLAGHLRDCTEKTVAMARSYIENARGGDEPAPTMNMRRVTTSMHPDTPDCQNTIEELGQRNQAWTVAAVMAGQFNERSAQQTLSIDPNFEMNILDRILVPVIA